MSFRKESCIQQIHMIPFSAVKGDGVEQLRAIIDEIAQDDAEQAREEPCR